MFPLYLFLCTNQKQVIQTFAITQKVKKVSSIANTLRLIFKIHLKSQLRVETCSFLS